MRKPFFCICENKDADQLRGNREADQRLCFRYTDSTTLYFLNPKFQTSSHLLWLYSLVCIGPGRKPRRPVFSERGSFINVHRNNISSRCPMRTCTSRQNISRSGRDRNWSYPVTFRSSAAGMTTMQLRPCPSSPWGRSCIW